MIVVFLLIPSIHSIIYRQLIAIRFIALNILAMNLVKNKQLPLKIIYICIFVSVMISWQAGLFKAKYFTHCQFKFKSAKHKPIPIFETVYFL